MAERGVAPHDGRYPARTNQAVGDGGGAVRLYHYTGTEHVRGIQLEGIRKGGWYWQDGSMINGVQWLTTDPDWRQSWATMQITHCDRSEARFSIVIPKHHRNKLLPWKKAAIQLGATEGYIREFERPGHEHWFVFFGSIPRGWLRSLELREKAPA